MINSVIFKTNELYVKQLDIKDLYGFTQLHTSKKVMDLIPMPVWDEEKSFIELQNRIASYDDSNASKHIWAVMNSKDNSFIGGCGLINENEKGFEIGYRFIEKFWGKGYGSEIAKGLIQYAFQHFKTHRVFAEVNIDNPGSIKILEKFMNRLGESYSDVYGCMNINFETLKQNYKS